MKLRILLSLLTVLALGLVPALLTTVSRASAQTAVALPPTSLAAMFGEDQADLAKILEREIQAPLQKLEATAQVLVLPNDEPVMYHDVLGLSYDTSDRTPRYTVRSRVYRLRSWKAIGWEEVRCTAELSAHLRTAQVNSCTEVKASANTSTTNNNREYESPCCTAADPVDSNWCFDSWDEYEAYCGDRSDRNSSYDEE